MDISNIIAISALLISLITLIFTIFNFLRDRSKVRVWSELYYTPASNSTDLDKLVPNLKIRIVNAGRRPIVISALIQVSLNFEYRSTSIIPPNLPHDGLGTLLNIPSIEDFSVQNTSLVLDEGKAFEIFIRYDDWMHYLINEDYDRNGYYEEVEKLYIEDVFKNKFYVKNSKENIEKFWNDFNNKEC